MTVKICPMYKSIEMGQNWYYYALHWSTSRTCYEPCPYLGRASITPPPTPCGACAADTNPCEILSGAQADRSLPVVVCGESKQNALDDYPDPANFIIIDPEGGAEPDEELNMRQRFVKHTPEGDGDTEPRFVARVMYFRKIKAKAPYNEDTQPFGIGYEVDPNGSYNPPPREVDSVTTHGKVAMATMPGGKTYCIVLHK